MNSKDSFVNILFISLIILAFLVFIFGIIQIGIEQSKIRYEMPNKVICKHLSGGSHGKTFYGCSDDKKYINPEFYEEFKK